MHDARSHAPWPVEEFIFIVGFLVLEARRKVIVPALLLPACLGIINASCLYGQTDVPSAQDCLILYDAAGSYSWLGRLHAQMLANLLGHFPLSYRIAPVENYQAGDLSSCRQIFYFGTVYDNPLPAAFCQEIVATDKPVCWFQYNLWQISGEPAFRMKFGFEFDYIDSAGYSNITYKAETLSKDQNAPELGRVSILNPAIVQVPAIAWGESPSNSIPYVVHSSNFWYVADSPFSYISEEDRYLVFADLLHDIVCIPHSESRRALIRLEDINPLYPLDALRAAGDYLARQNIPFAVSVIPVYVDPLGIYNNGQPETVPMTTTPAFIDTLKYLQTQGGQLVMHGCTHQYSNVINPYTGVSADDYEFFRVQVDAQGQMVEYEPVPEDSSLWASNRVQTGLLEFSGAGLRPVAWETPHYTASALDYAVFAQLFPLTLQRVVYFESSNHSAGQFFPYPIERDVYGQRIVPENLGNVEPVSWNGFPIRLPQDVVRAARKNRVIRDAWASAYFHPYLDLQYLREMVEGIKEQGYDFVRVADPPVIVSQPPDMTVSPGTGVSLAIEVNGTAPFNFQWQKDGSPLSGATNRILLIQDCQPMHSGLYNVSVSNMVDGTFSRPIRLTVIAPVLLDQVQLVTNSFQFSFWSETNASYQITTATNLANGSWTPVSTIQGIGGRVWFSEPLSDSRFYRVQAQ